MFFFGSGETMGSRHSCSWELWSVVSTWALEAWQSALLVKIFPPRGVPSPKACAHFFFLHAAIWAEVFPADTTYRRVERQSSQRGKIRTPYAVAADACALDRQTTSLCLGDTKFSEMLPQLDECVRTAVDFRKDVVDV